MTTNQSPAPEGNNPDDVSPESVGAGWRLLDRDEITRREEAHTEIEMWFCHPSGHWESGGFHGNGRSNTYRTRLTRKELALLK